MFVVVCWLMLLIVVFSYMFLFVCLFMSLLVAVVRCCSRLLCVRVVFVVDVVSCCLLFEFVCGPYLRSVVVV